MGRQRKQTGQPVSKSCILPEVQSAFCWTFSHHETAGFVLFCLFVWFGFFFLWGVLVGFLFLFFVFLGGVVLFCFVFCSCFCFELRVLLGRSSHLHSSLPSNDDFRVLIFLAWLF